MLDAQCPFCGTPMTINVDLSEGVPSEVGQECSACGAIPVFSLSWEPKIYIDGFKYYEKCPSALVVENES